MKNYRQLVKELPSKSIVISFDSFSPPTAQHELGFKLVEKLVKLNGADHAVYIKETIDSLPAERQQHFLDIMFNGVNFVTLRGTLEEEVAHLKKRYKNVIVVTSEDSKKAINKSLMESVQVVVAEDINEVKMKSIISKGDYTSFKKNMPAAFRDIDAKRLFNEMREVYGLDIIKEEVKFSIDTLRDKYFKGEIYHIGDIVESAGHEYEIMDRGTNYLVVVDKVGNLHRKWVKDVNLVEACWKGYKQLGLKKKNGKQVPNCIPESILNPKDPHGDYLAKKKVLLDLGKNKDVDQDHVRQRNLDLDAEYRRHKLKEEADVVQEGKDNYNVTIHHVHPDGSKEDYNYKVHSAVSERHAKHIAMQKHEKRNIPFKNFGASSQDVHKLDEQHTAIAHNSDHKVISHGQEFAFRIHKDHHDKIKNLEHNEKYSFKCMDGIEYGARKVGDKLHFQQHPGDSGIHGNLSIHIPHEDFVDENPKEVTYKGYTTRNLHNDPRVAKAFKRSMHDANDPIAMLNAIKTTDAYMELHNSYGDNPPIDKVRTWKGSHIKAKESLQKLGMFTDHEENWLNHNDVLNTMLKNHGEIGKHSNANIERSAMTYQDVMKAYKINRGVMPSTKEVSVAIEPNVSQQIDDLEPNWPRHVQTAVGHTLATDPHLRRRKSMYAVHESVEGDMMDPEFADKFMAEGEVGSDTVVKVKPLPPELAPKKKDADRLGGGTRDHTFSAFMEKQKSLKKENPEFDFDQMTKRRLAKE